MGIYLDDEKEQVVPAQLCTVSRGQRYIRQLSKEQQTVALRDMTQIPGKRWDNITQGMQVSRYRTSLRSVIQRLYQFFDHRNSPYLLQANMDVSSACIMADGEQIGPPIVRYAGPPQPSPQGPVTPQISVNVVCSRASYINQYLKHVLV